MIYRLVCDNDPAKLGIKDEQGTWNVDKLLEHLDRCQECKEYYTGWLLGNKMEGEVSKK